MFVKSFINKWLIKKLEPKNRCMYACLHGKYIGKMFVYINKENNLYNFLMLPDMNNISLTFEHFKIGIENYVIDKVKILDKKYWNICREKFNKNIIENKQK